MTKKKNGKDDCFRVVTKEEIYQEVIGIRKDLDKFNEANEKAHMMILERIDKEVSIATLEVQKAKMEHEKIRGSVNTVKATMALITTLVVLALGWLFILPK